MRTESWKPRVPVSEKPLFEAIADEIEAAITAGTLRPGERLPTHRELARDLRVGIGTVTHAYSMARARGLLTGEIGRGTYVLRRDPTSAGEAIEARGFPGEQREFAEALRSSLHALAKRPRLSDLITEVEHLGGLRSREAGAEWIRRMGIKTSANQVIATPGARIAIDTLLRSLVRPGEIVLCEHLSWLAPLTRLPGTDFVGLPMNGEGILPEALEEACRVHSPKVLVCNPSLHIPTSALMPTQRRTQIAEICERFDLWIIEDDPGGPLVRDQVSPLSKMLPERTFYLADPSPLLHPGVKACYLHIPLAMVEKVNGVLLAMAGRTAKLEQEVLRLWIEDGTAERLLSIRKVDFARRQSVARPILKGLAYQTHPRESEIWITLPERWRSPELAKLAREGGVKVDAGTNYEVVAGAGERGICLHLAGVSMDRLAHNVRLLRSLIDSDPPS